jgi:tetratricopeptide (TPR) repeat protein
VALESGIGCALAERLHFAKAEGHFRHVVTRIESTMGKDHPSISLDLDNLGEVLSEEGKYVEALAMHERSLALLSTWARTDHSDTRVASLGIGRARARMGDAAGALPHLERAAAPPAADDDRVVAQARFELARVLAALGRTRPAHARSRRRHATRSA